MNSIHATAITMVMVIASAFLAWSSLISGEVVVAFWAGVLAPKAVAVATKAEED